MKHQHTNELIQKVKESIIHQAVCDEQEVLIQIFIASEW
jgi:hypothetical protein